MAKSQLNNLSKRQILESLMYEQNQSNATLSRLITAVARTIGAEPEKLAQMFVDDQGNQEFVEKFNTYVKAHHATKQAQNEADQAAIASDESLPKEDTTEADSSEESNA
jgi:hypothetical protein